MIDSLDDYRFDSDKYQSYKRYITIEGEEIDVAKSNNIKEYIVCHYWYCNYGFKFQNLVCNGCHDLTMLLLNLSDIALITVKSVDYCCIIHDISKSNAIQFLENSVFDDCGYKGNNHYFENLTKAKKSEIKTILIDEKKTIRIWWSILLDVFARSR